MIHKTVTTIVIYTGSRAVRYLTRMWGENFATGDIAQESERYIRIPLEAGRLFVTEWGHSPSNIPTVSHIEIPECCFFIIFTSNSAKRFCPIR